MTGHPVRPSNGPESRALRNRRCAAPAEPTPAELAAIDAEWPLIRAELAVVEAECRLADSPDALAVRAHRRAVRSLSLIVCARSSESEAVHPLVRMTVAPAPAAA